LEARGKRGDAVNGGNRMDRMPPVGREIDKGRHYLEKERRISKTTLSCPNIKRTEGAARVCIDKDASGEQDGQVTSRGGFTEWPRSRSRLWFEADVDVDTNADADGSFGSCEREGRRVDLGWLATAER
jgi:hypothetical protein